MQIEYRPLAIGKGVGNETPYTIGNPYRRIRVRNSEWGKMYFVLRKGVPYPVTDFANQSQFDEVF